MNSHNKFFVELVCIVLLIGQGCSNNKPTIPIHGNFCGLDYPELSSKSEEEQRQELEMIKACDDIDRVCKAHDLCYLERGTNDIVCDYLLIFYLDSLGLSPPCSNKAYDMRQYFENIHPNRGLTEYVLNSIFGLPFSILVAASNVIYTPLAMASNYNTDKCNESEEWKKNHEELNRRKRELMSTHIYPEQDRAWHNRHMENNDAYEIGQDYDWGRGVERNINKAIEWYEKSFSKSAMNRLGKIYLYGVDGIQQDEKKAMIYFKQAKRLGSNYGNRMVDFLEYKPKFQIFMDTTGTTLDNKNGVGPR